MQTNPAVRIVAVAALGLFGAGVLALDASAAVGRTESAYGVTPSGRVSYTIPIVVTDGINGLTPSLAITYTGPGTRTILGIGFALSGISYITPCRKTIAQDVNAAPVTLTSADRYCLDGARLRLWSGTPYGATDTTYKTELDQKLRATAKSSTSNIPGWFKVEMPNGLIYEYGNSADSKLLASGAPGAPPQFWAVNKISDRSGNSISFVYDTDSALRRFRPDYILYTASSLSAAKYQIDFVYASATESEPTIQYTPSNVGAAAHSDDKLLERIDLLHEGAVYRKYLFAYQTGAANNRRLSSIQECVPGAPDDCLPATQLTWQDASLGYASPVTTSAVAGFIPLDVNGDGIEDLVWSASGTWRYMLGSATGYGAVINTGVAATNPSKAMPLEWNGDGFWDLLVDWSDGNWRVLRGSSSGFLPSVIDAGPSPVPSGSSNLSWTIADVDSDGRDDLLKMYLNATLQILVHVNGPTGFGASQIYYTQLTQHSVSNGFIPMNGGSSIRRPDFNGDGRTDLLVYACEWESRFFGDPPYCYLDSWRALISNGTSFLQVGGLPYATLSIDPRYADFNADGLTDVVYPAQTPGTWYIGFGQGSGNLSYVAGPSFTNYENYKILTGDHDGDGYDDLYAATLTSLTWEVFHGSPSGFASAQSTGISSAGIWAIADQTGDGLPDLGRWDSAGSAWSSYAHLGVPGDRLLTGTDGLGNKGTFTYLPMTSSTVYTKGSGAAYPLRDYQSAMPLVRKVLAEPAGGSSYTLTYKYATARLHNQGRSFLGMQSRKITDGRDGVYTTETYEQDFPYIGSQSTVTIKQSSVANAPAIQSVTNTYSKHDLDLTSGNERYLPYLSRTLTKDYEVNIGGNKDGLQITESTEDFTVNTFGQTTAASVVTVDKDLGSSEYGQSYTTAIAATYLVDQTNWCLEPLSRSETRTLPGAIVETRAVSWVVPGLECRVTQETIEPNAGSTVALVTDVGYDGCGNINSLSAYPAGLPAQARTTAINYGTRCQRPESITNPLNQISTIAYNWPLALPATQTDPNGIAVTLEYDGFGRLTRQLRPDGTAARFALTACTAGNSWCGKNNGARLKVTRTERDNADGLLRTDEQFLDGLGRVRWSHSDSLESGPAIVETLYDAFGRPNQKTQPYFAGGVVYATSYLRDLIGRVTQINAPIDEANTGGRITGLAYEGRDLKITDPRNSTTTRRSDAIGQLRAVIDPSPGGTASYAYRPFGEIASITDAAGNASTWSYNPRGFVIGTTDPDAGSSIYVPNAFGELTSQTDAKSQNVSFTYDKLSRPLTRIEAEGTTTWTWGQLSHNTASNKYVGRLKSIASPGGYVEGYLFDSLARLTRQRTTIDAVNYDVNLTYLPATGLVDTLQYPVSTSGFRLKIQYVYLNQLLKRVKEYQGTTTYWEATSTDAYGHIQNETFGNGVLTFTDFDQASGLMSAREGGVGGGTGLINSQVAWDLNGNLAQRQDLKLSPTQTEDFFYDSLNRLDRSNRNGAQNLDVTLDTIGNITSKGGLSYTYSGTQSGCSYYAHPQPRAVRKIGTSTVYCYDANGNMTKRAGSSIGYTSYNLPNVINSGSNSSTISYGAYRNRYKQVAVNAGATETTIYVAGLLAKVSRGSLIEYRHTIAGGNGAAAIHTRRSGGTPASDTVYVHQDHLGSPELITSASGTKVVRLSFGAYGERRDGTDWEGPVSAANLTTIGNTSRQGFTGHEHLDAVSLIHMNGRVYEPVAGRFLSVDPIVQLGSSQSPNRYAYVLNNPLTLIDPSGFLCELGDDDVWRDCLNAVTSTAGQIVDRIRGNPIDRDGDLPGRGQGGSSIGGTKGGGGHGDAGSSEESDQPQGDQGKCWSPFAGGGPTTDALARGANLITQVFDSFTLTGEFGFQVKGTVNFLGINGTATFGALNYSLGTSAAANVEASVRVAMPGDALYVEVSGGIGKTKIGVARGSVVDGISVRRGPYEDYEEGFFFKPATKLKNSKAGKIGAHLQAGVGVSGEVDLVKIAKAFLVCPYQ